MSVTNSYDDVPYWGHPYRESHPDQLMTMTRMFGLEAPDVDRSRVLELGCASGANLIPMAVSIPGSTFLGIDLSHRQIDVGQTAISSLGLTNIKLVHGSIDSIGADHGLFDYIICHGVYSWVPRHIQDHILRICRENLTPNGVAYVSYNTHPGWFMRGMVRQMMKFHSRRFSDPQTQLGQACALLEFLSTASSAVDETYCASLCRELNLLKQCNDSYIYHEHLEENNEPLFFHEFNARAEAAGLRYLSEPHLSEMVPVNIPVEIADVLGQIGMNIVEFEQYFDFVKNRTFRRTLLCHTERIPDREVGPKRFQQFRFASPLKRRGKGNEWGANEAWEFSSGGDTHVTVTSSVHKALLTVLEQIWPASMAGHELVHSAQKMWNDSNHGNNPESIDLTAIAEMVLPLYLRNLIEISLSTPRFQRSVSDHPEASPYARYQAKSSMIVTNLRQERVQLGALVHQLIQHLDGKCDRSTLELHIKLALATGQLTITAELGPLAFEEQTPQLMAELVHQGLASLARQALLSSEYSEKTDCRDAKFCV